MTSGGPELFVICKSCQSEVSPYITECPYCGARLRKRAPKLDRDGRIQEKRSRRTRRRPPAPSLGRLRPGEIPGIRADHRPWVTGAAVVGSLVVVLLWRGGLLDLAQIAIVGRPEGEWWRLLTAPFGYSNTGYAFAALTAIAIFGSLVERRHGPLAALALILLGGAGGMALAVAVEAFPTAIGGNGVALALIVAWLVPDLRDVRAGREIEGDLIGAGVFAAVLLLMPAVVDEADWLAGVGGAGVGAVVGLALDRLGRRG